MESKIPPVSTNVDNNSVGNVHALSSSNASMSKIERNLKKYRKTGRPNQEKLVINILQTPAIIKVI
jgi:hypothetical protein